VEKKQLVSKMCVQNVVALSEICGVKQCGVKMWRQAQMSHVVAPPKSWKCGVKQGGVKMWRQAQMWWRLRNRGNVASNNVASGTNVAAVRNVASNNVASKCGVRHPPDQTVF